MGTELGGCLQANGLGSAWWWAEEHGKVAWDSMCSGRKCCAPACRLRATCGEKRTAAVAAPELSTKPGPGKQPLASSHRLLLHSSALCPAALAALCSLHSKCNGPDRPTPAPALGSDEPPKDTQLCTWRFTAISENTENSTRQVLRGALRCGQRRQLHGSSQAGLHGT